MASYYRIILTVHIIAVISWMAGVLYLYRLFVYHAEETENNVKVRFTIMEKRLYRYITMPAMTVAFLAGISMLYENPSLIHYPWMKAKLLFVSLLMGITHIAKKFQKDLEKGTSTVKSRTFRILNEVPTLLMILIVSMVILQPFS